MAKFLIGQVERVGEGAFGPAGLFVGAAAGAGAGVWLKFFAAVRAGVHGRKNFESAADAGVFIVHAEVNAHKHIVVCDGGHVFDVIFESEERGEPKECKDFHGGFLFADELSFDAFESATARDLDDLGDERAGESAITIPGMHEDAYAPDVTFPPAKLLMQCGRRHDFAVVEREQGKVASEVNVLTPTANDGEVSDAVFDEHPFGFGHGE